MGRRVYELVGQVTLRFVPDSPQDGYRQDNPAQTGEDGDKARLGRLWFVGRYSAPSFNLWSDTGSTALHQAKAHVFERPADGFGTF